MPYKKYIYKHACEKGLLVQTVPGKASHSSRVASLTKVCMVFSPPTQNTGCHGTSAVVSTPSSAFFYSLHPSLLSNFLMASPSPAGGCNVVEWYSLFSTLSVTLKSASVIQTSQSLSKQMVSFLGKALILDQRLKMLHCD